LLRTSLFDDNVVPMSALPPAGEDAAVLRDAIAEASQGFEPRRELIEAIVLAALAGEHVLIVGPPGTGRSVAARSVARILGGRYFEYLLGRTVDPLELFGPFERKSGVIAASERAGMLADAEVAFLEEVFEVQTSMMNQLQWWLDERVFRRGDVEVPCALKVCVGAASTLDDQPALRAYDERFLLRYFAQPVSDEQLESLMSAGWPRRGDTSSIVLGLARFERLARAVDEVQWPLEVRRALADLVRRIRAAGVEISDERAVRAQRLVAASAVLAGRTTVSTEHLAAVTLAVRTAEGQRIARALSVRPVAHTLKPHAPFAKTELALSVDEIFQDSPTSTWMTAAPSSVDAREICVEATAPLSASSLHASAVASEARRSKTDPHERWIDDAPPGAPNDAQASVRPSSAPPSAGKATMPASYRRSSLPGPSRRSPSGTSASRGEVSRSSRETKTFEAPSKPKRSKRPAPWTHGSSTSLTEVATRESDARSERGRGPVIAKAPSLPPALTQPVAKNPARSDARSDTQRRALRRTGEPLSPTALLDEARALLRETVPDGGAQLEEWRASVEAVVADVDKLAQSGAAPEALRVLRGLLVDALDSSWSRTRGSRAG
jgi:MoxR-like ATPase